MTVRFLLHNRYSAGGGILTVTLGLAEAMARITEVEVVSLFGAGRTPVHPVTDNLRTVDLVPRGVRGSGGDWDEPSKISPRGEPRYKQYSRATDRILQDYLGSLHEGTVVTMQPGLNVPLARLGHPGIIKIAQHHRPVFEASRGVSRAYAKWAAGWDAFLTLTDSDTEFSRELIGDATVVRTMMNGTPRFTGATSTLTNPLVVSAGRLEHSKGFDILIDSWRGVADRHPEWRLDIYGEGSERGALQEQIRRLGLDGVVTLRGFSTTLMNELADASIFALASRSEGYGMVLVEAMACGVPVVSTDAPHGPRQIIDQGVDGLLVPNTDVRALTQALNTMIELDPSARAAMGAAAVASAESRSYDRVAVNWMDLIAELREAARD